MTQVLLWRAVWEDGLAEGVGAARSSPSRITRRVCCRPCSWPRPEPAGSTTRCWSATCAWAWTVGTHAALGAHAAGSPLATISGIRAARLAPLLDAVNAEVGADDAVSVALVNSARRIVVGGPPQTLALLRAQLAEQARAEDVLRQRGWRGGAPLQFGWSALAVEREQ